MTLDADIGCCTVAEVMGTDLLTLTPQTSVASARHLVDVSGNDHLIVIQDGTLAGIVCDVDLRAADRDACVGDCMTSPVLCISAETTLQEAIDIMGANDVDCLPVVTGAFLVGMVTRAALALADEAARENGTCTVCGPSESAAVYGDPDDDVYLCARCRRSINATGRC